MRSLTYLVKDIPTLRDYLNCTDIRTNASVSASILIQVFSSLTHKEILESINDELLKAMPNAIIVGSTSVGEIMHGLLQVGTTVLSISFFDETALKAIVISEPGGRESAAGKELMCSITGLGQSIAGVLMLATPMSVDVAKLFRAMSEENFSFPVFGGGAGVYDPNQTSMIFLGSQYFGQGAIAVIFLGEKLHICIKTFLGWKPLSKELTVTEADGMLLKKIDGERAFDVYNRYLGISNDKNFFNNALEFPILVHRNGEWIARIPFLADGNGYIGFLADIESGEKFHIGYGDPDSILKNSTTVQRELYDFEPESIFLYACISRRFLMQNSVNLETQSFDLIAPTTGFYTYGEFFSSGNGIHLLNSTIVVAAFREGEKGRYVQQTPYPLTEDVFAFQEQDPFSNKHSRIISRLLHFISVVTSELEDANNELKKLSRIDKLTQINNRLKLDEALQYELSRSERYGVDLSVLMLDLDHFKNVNDRFGHLVGDIVLIEIGNILKNSVRESDTVGRWGGEEFLIILPQTKLTNALEVAEKIRVAVEQTLFPEAKRITCSIGAATFRKDDDQEKLVFRADMALYDAKNSGRNRVAGEKAEE